MISLVIILITDNSFQMSQQWKTRGVLTDDYHFLEFMKVNINTIYFPEIKSNKDFHQDN